jgi:hypothetical protein
MQDRDAMLSLAIRHSVEKRGFELAALEATVSAAKIDTSKITESIKRREGQIMAEICGEMVEAGEKIKPKYSNTEARDAELSMRTLVDPQIMELQAGLETLESEKREFERTASLAKIEANHSGEMHRAYVAALSGD